jgi:hypothetical protein
LNAISVSVFLAEHLQRTGASVDPPPIGKLAITAFNMIAFGLVAVALAIGGLLFLRVAHFSRSRR